MLVPLVLLCVCIVVLSVILDARDKKRVPIPTPPTRWPIIGNLPRILKSRLKGQPLESLLEGFERMGHTFQINLFWQRIVFITDPEDLKHFFQGNFNNYVKGAFVNDVAHDIFGGGIFNNDGEKWRVQRQTASSMFHFENMKAFLPIFQNRAEDLTSHLASAGKDNQKFDVQKLFQRYTMDSIGELGFGISIASQKGNPAALEFSEAFDMVQAATGLRSHIHPLWKILPQSTFKKNMRIVDQFFQDIIDERRKEVKDLSDSELAAKTDLLSRFMSAKTEDGKPAFDNQYLLDVLKNFIIAGRDTTAVTLTWAFYLLAKHPEVERKLLEEMNAVLGSDPNAELTHEKVNNLKYMKNVIDETLRLYPPVPMNERTTVNDDWMPSTGYFVPANTMVVYSAYALHRLKEFYPEPTKFDPSRWDTIHLKPYQFVPFHGGPRICLGQNMAYQEIKVAMCAILRKYSLVMASNEPVRYQMSLTLPAKNGMWMKLVPRKSFP